MVTARVAVKESTSVFGIETEKRNRGGLRILSMASPTEQWLRLVTGWHPTGTHTQGDQGIEVFALGTLPTFEAAYGA